MNKGIYSCIDFVFIYTETPQQHLRIRKLNHKFIRRSLTTGTSLQSAYHNLFTEDPKIFMSFYYALMYKLPVLYWKLQKFTLQNTVVAHTVQVQSQPVDSLRKRTTKCLGKNPKSLWTCDVSSPKDSMITSPYARGIFQASLTCWTCYYYMFWCENLLSVWCAVTQDSKSISITWEAESCVDIDGSRALLVDCHSNDEDQGDVEMSRIHTPSRGQPPKENLWATTILQYTPTLKADETYFICGLQQCQWPALLSPFCGRA